MRVRHSLIGGDTYVVDWDCPECNMMFDRYFKDEQKMYVFLGKLYTKGCPGRPWFPDEDHSNNDGFWYPFF